MIDFKQYSEALEDQQRQPYCQLISPKDSDDKFGIFITLDEAEAAEFVPDEHWEMTENKFKSSDGSSITRKGYMMKMTEEDGFPETFPYRMVVVRFSPAFVYQGSQIVGPLYDTSSGKRELTNYGELAEDPKQSDYYKANKLLVYFLNESLQPLSQKPFQFKIKGAFRGSFSTNFIQYQSEFEKIFLEQAKKSGLFKGTKRLNPKYLTLAIFKFTISKRIAKEGTEVCVLSKIFLPSSTDIGKKRKNQKNDITFILSDISDVFIDLYGDNKDFAHQLFEDVDNYASFGQPPKENDNKEKDEKLAKIYNLVKQLGWTNQEAISFLQQNYDKSSRKFLTNNEIDDCIKSLINELPLVDQLYHQFIEAGMEEEDIEAFCLEQGVSQLEDLDDSFLKDQLEKKSPSESGKDSTVENQDHIDDIPF